jgi:hypothetical protein
MGSVLLMVVALLLNGQAGTPGDRWAAAPGGPASALAGQAAPPGGQAAALAGQTTPPGSSAAAPAGQPAPQGGAASSPGTPPATPSDAAARGLPVSLDHIRAALARAPEQPLLRGTDRKPDFQVTVEERLKLEELLWSLDYKTGPVPPGGLYAYEQQRLLWNKTDHPLLQPYGAFNSGQLVTIAVEGIVEKYAGGPALNALTGAQRKQAEGAARAEVSREIAEYCAAQPDRSHIEICWMGISH